LKTQFDRYVASVAMLWSHVWFVKLKKSDEPGVKPGTIVASYDTDLVRHYMRQNSLTQ
jgi:leucyl-tRNA synthetase